VRSSGSRPDLPRTELPTGYPNVIGKCSIERTPPV
jgi:hypothetical protein